MSCISDSDKDIFDFSNNRTRQILNALFTFKIFYGAYHRYIALLLCVIGLAANTLHICVLTRPQMRRSAVHTILTCIAIADMGTMTSYLIYITRFEFFSSPIGYSYNWAGFLKIHAVVSISLHALSIYLVVLMALIRYLAMDAGHRKWMMPQPAIIISLIVALCIFILCIPTFYAHEIYQNEIVRQEQRPPPNVDYFVLDPEAMDVEEPKYSISFSKSFEANDCKLFRMNLWLTGIALKAIPCILLLIFTFALLKKLNENDRKRRSLLKSSREKPRRLSTDRTTTMLLLMVFIFLMTELPQGILAILNAIFTVQFHGLVYTAFADTLDLLSLINCYVAFLIYCITSSKYRQTLFMMLPICKSEYSTPPLTSAGTGKPLKRPPSIESCGSPNKSQADFV